MRRRFLILLAAAAATAGRAGARQALPDLWLNLIAELKRWALLHNETAAGSYSAAARRQWDQVRAAFHEIDLAVRNE